MEREKGGEYERTSRASNSSNFLGLQMTHSAHFSDCGGRLQEIIRQFNEIDNDPRTNKAEWSSHWIQKQFIDHIQALEKLAGEMAERMNNIVGLANSYGDNPMPNSTYTCACEANSGLELYHDFEREGGKDGR